MGTTPSTYNGAVKYRTDVIITTQHEKGTRMREQNIKGFKLMNGSEMIGNILSETDQSYEIEDAIFWDLVQLEQGKYDVQFTPLTYGAKTAPDATHQAVNMTLPKMAVLFPYVLRDEIEMRYRQLVSPIILLK